MPHVRSQIVAAGAARITGLPASGNNVFVQRKYPAGRNRLPALLVYRGGEASQPSEMGASPRETERTFDWHIEAIAEGDDAEDILDDILAVSVEAAIAADRTLGGIARETMLVSTEPGPASDRQGEKAIATLRMTFRSFYLTTDLDPTTAT